VLPLAKRKTAEHTARGMKEIFHRHKEDKALTRRWRLNLCVSLTSLCHATARHALFRGLQGAINNVPPIGALATAHRFSSPISFPLSPSLLSPSSLPSPPSVFLSLHRLLFFLSFPSFQQIDAQAFFPSGVSSQLVGVDPNRPTQWVYAVHDFLLKNK
jgi:hypothetical protein